MQKKTSAKKTVEPLIALHLAPTLRKPYERSTDQVTLAPAVMFHHKGFLFSLRPHGFHTRGVAQREPNPLLKDLLEGMEYYWVMDQAEYATDVMFESVDALKEPYQEFLKHATLSFGAEDVLTFLGRKMHSHFQGEVLTDLKKKRFPGARVKHRMKENWIKMYDKLGSVLRVETVINNPKEFQVRRRGMRNGEEVMGWFPMAKGVANMPRYQEVGLAANRRYLEALSVVNDPGNSKKQMREL